MGEVKLFILLVTDMGLWMATCVKSAYENWEERGTKLRVNDVRGYNITPDHQTKQVRVDIGNAYPVDLAQKSVAVNPTAVEIIGEVLVNESGEYCTDNSSLFTAYKSSVMNWRAARSNITLADPSMMPTGQPLPSNVRPFPKR